MTVAISNSPTRRRTFAEADLFVLPDNADSQEMALMETAAAGHALARPNFEPVSRRAA
jgi:hypothetical protein